MHVWSFRLSCETPAAPPNRAAGARTRQPENSKRAHLRVPALQTPPKFNEKTPRERRKNEISGGREKKSAKFWAVQGKGGPAEGGPGERTKNLEHTHHTHKQQQQQQPSTTQAPPSTTKHHQQAPTGTNKHQQAPSGTNRHQQETTGNNRQHPGTTKNNNNNNRNWPKHQNTQIGQMRFWPNAVLAKCGFGQMRLAKCANKAGQPTGQGNQQAGQQARQPTGRATTRQGNQQASTKRHQQAPTGTIRHQQAPTGTNRKQQETTSNTQEQPRTTTTTTENLAKTLKHPNWPNAVMAKCGLAKCCHDRGFTTKPNPGSVQPLGSRTFVGAGIRLHTGKTRAWNRGGIRPPDLDESGEDLWDPVGRRICAESH